MRPLYFALGCLLGMLSGGVASKIDGPAPDYVLWITGAMIVVVVLVMIWISEDERKG